jgi:hypothetical protein
MTPPFRVPAGQNNPSILVNYDIEAEDFTEGITQLTFLPCIGILKIGALPALVRLSIPNATELGAMLIQQTPNLQTLIGCNNLTTVGDELVLKNLPNLTTIPSFSALRQVGDRIEFAGCPALETWPIFTNLSELVGDMILTDCAVPSAVVNSVLAKLAAIGWAEPGKTCDLTGTTNAGPTGQGLIDKAALIAAGANVLTN